MHYRLLGYFAIASLSALIGVSVASAQPRGTASPAARPIKGPDRPGTRGAIGAEAIEAGAAKARTPEEQLAQAEQFLQQVEGVLRTVEADLNSARQKKDVVKTLCLDDKMNQLDVLKRSIESRRRQLKVAASGTEDGLPGHHYTILLAQHERGLQLQAEANQCIGKELRFIGESSVTMERDDGLPIDDPSDFPIDSVIVQPPQCSSCYR